MSWPKLWVNPVNSTFGLPGKKAALAAALAKNKACKGHAQCFGGSPQRALKVG